MQDWPMVIRQNELPLQCKEFRRALISQGVGPTQLQEMQTDASDTGICKRLKADFGPPFSGFKRKGL